MAGLVIQNHADVTKTLALDGGDVTIGRNASCEIVLADETASRQHARICFLGQKYVVEDLHSTNGTIVNGQRIDQPTRLHHGDRIEFGTGTITFVEDESATGAAMEQLPRRDTTSQRTLDRPDEPDTLFSENITQFDVRLDGILNESSDKHIRLLMLIDIVRSLGNAYDADEILRSIAGSLFGILPQAKRGMIFTTDSSDDEIRLAEVRYRSAEFEGATLDPHCYTVAKQSLSQGKAILRRSAPSPTYGNGRSVLDFVGVSLLCVPIVGHSRTPLGAIYVDSDEGPFSEEDLDLLACIGVLAGQAVEQSRLHAARYRAVVDTAVDAIITFDAAGTIESSNPAAVKLFGYPLEELVGRNVQQLIPLHEQGSGIGALDHVLAQRAAPDWGSGREVVGRHKNGATFPIYLSLGEFELAGATHFTGIIHDITDRKRAEDALRASRDRLSSMVKTDVVGIAFFDAHGRAFESNEAFRRLSGYTAEQINARSVNWRDLTLQIRPELKRKASLELRDSGRLGPCEAECLRCDKGRVSVLLSAARLPGQTGAKGEEEYVAFFVDNSEQKRAEKELKALNESLEQRVRARTKYVRLLQENAVISNNAEVVTEALQSALDRIRVCMNWPAAHVLLPATPAGKTFESTDIWSIGRFENVDGLKAAFRERPWPGGTGMIGKVIQTKTYQWRKRCAHHPERDLSNAFAHLGIQSTFALPIVLGEQVCGILVFLSDKSEAPDPALLEVTTNIGTQLGRVVERRRLQQELIDAVWKQQKRFGQELHDTLGQELGGIRMMADSLRWKLDSQKAPEAATVAELIQSIHHLQTGVSRMAKGLFPVEVDREGLMAALDEFADTISHQGETKCVFRCERAVEVQNNDIATHLFRIAQEAANNGIRHGRASRIEISLTAANGELALKIEDNGVGIGSKEDQLPNGMGLRIMRYRAGVIGGMLDVAPSPGGGTTVTCTIHQGNGHAKA